jgi:hypothetical protein
VHDISDLEGRGLPGVFVATTEFVDAAIRQGEALGVTEAGVFVAHPIQDRTKEEVCALAEEALSQILTMLLEPSSKS